MNFNSKDFNLKQIIQDRVNKESTHLWAVSTQNSINLPNYKKIEGIKKTAGYYNFMKDILKEGVNQLRP